MADAWHDSLLLNALRVSFILMLLISSLYPITNWFGAATWAMLSYSIPRFVIS